MNFGIIADRKHGDRKDGVGIFYEFFNFLKPTYIFIFYGFKKSKEL